MRSPSLTCAADEGERRAARQEGIEPLARELSELLPGQIVVIMKAIEPEVRRAAAIAGLRGVPFDALPFPAQGNQRRYIDELPRLLREGR